ncbi:MAG: hypothetical protein IKF77_08275 [Thermoguttaceae bacterium]|nr:hypothetical protein [Thermoguttaceae bacterium]
MRRKSAFSLGVLLFALTALAVCLRGAAAEPVEIPRSFPAGSYTMNQEYFSSLIRTLAGVKETFQERINLYWRVTVEPADAGTEMTLELRRATYLSRDAHQWIRPETFDTDTHGATEEAEAVYRLLRSATIKITFDAAMVVVKIEGAAPLCEKLSEYAEKVRLAAVTAGMLDERSLTDSYAQLTFLLPQGKVSAGDHWNSSVALTLPLTGRTDVTWQTEFLKDETVGSDRLATLAGHCHLMLDDLTSVTTDLTAVYNTADGLNTELTTRSVVTRTETKTVNDQDWELRTVGMVQGSQTISRYGR